MLSPNFSTTAVPTSVVTCSMRNAATVKALTATDTTAYTV
jgi:hypothetical protein